MNTSTEIPTKQKKTGGLLPAWFALAAIAPLLLMTILGHQPKEVVAGVYSGIVAVGAMIAGGAFVKKGRPRAAKAALVICAVFTALFVVYAYMAYDA